MRLGIIGPIRSIKRINSIIDENFEYIDVVQLNYNVYNEAPKLAEKNQKFLDGLLFTGTTPFILASKLVDPNIPWEYIPRHGTSLLSVLLEASVIYKYDISKISFDCYDSPRLFEAYEEIGFSEDKLNIFIAEEKICEEGYLDYLYSFHRQNYIDGKVTCCITGLVNVYKRLRDEEIPCFKIKHTANIIREIVTKLKLKHLANINRSNQIVVISVEIDNPDEQSIINKNEYQMALKKMKVTEQIYLFAQRIQAAVVELEFGSYLLFTTKSILESETDNLNHLDLIDMINKNTKSTVSTGIGYGRTAREAKYGANLGKERAKKSGGNKVFAVYEGMKIVGPINNINPRDTEKEKIDNHLFEISKKSGLGINTIFKLNSLIRQYRLDTVTPKELARLYGITPRSMNRILNKLEENGYIKTVGNQIIGDAGRPSRLIKLLLS